METTGLRLTDRGYAGVLDASHYLGSAGSRAKLVYSDVHGVIVFSGPSSRRLPQDWLELSRWCITSGRGSQQWKDCVRFLRREAPSCTTVVSYSDPDQGHTGALYRACNWIWAPVWHQLRPPPTGAGTRGGKRQAAKARWVYLLQPDDRREESLRLKDASLEKKYPWAGYAEPTWRRGVPVITPECAGRFKRWAS